MRRIGILAIAFVTIANSASAISCSAWWPNTNGTKWRICTDDQGQRYCELKQSGKVIRIVCP